MHRSPLSKEFIQIEGDPKGLSKGSSRVGKLAYLAALVASLALVAVVLQAVTANAKEPELPYVTIAHPQFIAASQATFLHPNDLLIGLSDGKTVKAYPAAILAQHGVVQDQMPDGPIAVTW